MVASCRICLVEFEPKTPTVPVVNGSVHCGCYDKLQRYALKEQQVSELKWRG